MRLSEFRSLVEGEFGARYAGTLLRDHVLRAVGGRTANEAIEAGTDPKEVWFALCDDFDVPAERRWGPATRARRPH